MRTALDRRHTVGKRDDRFVVAVVILQRDLGDVVLTVTNCSTGNVWYDSFDSTLEPQTMLPISGEPGVYEITYITESGNIYEGTFIID